MTYYIDFLLSLCNLPAKHTADLPARRHRHPAANSIGVRLSIIDPIGVDIDVRLTKLRSRVGRGTRQK